MTKPLPDGLLRTHTVKVRLTPAERETAYNLAKGAGVTVSEWIRSLIERAKVSDGPTTGR